MSFNWVRRCLLHFQHQSRITSRSFCNLSNNQKQSKMEMYRELENLDFTKAAKILFSSPPPNKNKFGLDFHLVQLFFALMPSLAVYLVAQYARYDMRKMEKELEVKKKAEEEQKAKEMEAMEEEEKEVEASNPELLQVKERLEALENTIKQIVVESTQKKQPSESITSVNQNTDQNQKKVDAEKNQPTSQKPSQKQFDVEKMPRDEKTKK